MLVSFDDSARFLVQHAMGSPVWLYKRYCPYEAIRAAYKPCFITVILSADCLKRDNATTTKIWALISVVQRQRRFLLSSRDLITVKQVERTQVTDQRCYLITKGTTCLVGNEISSGNLTVEVQNIGHLQ